MKTAQGQCATKQRQTLQQRDSATKRAESLDMKFSSSR